jgi:hypothetical protein
MAIWEKKEAVRDLEPDGLAASVPAPVPVPIPRRINMYDGDSTHATSCGVYAQNKRRLSMIPKIRYRLSQKIMLHQ